MGVAMDIHYRLGVRTDRSHGNFNIALLFTFRRDMQVVLLCVGRVVW